VGALVAFAVNTMAVATSLELGTEVGMAVKNIRFFDMHSVLFTETMTNPGPKVFETVVQPDRFCAHLRLPTLYVELALPHSHLQESLPFTRWAYTTSQQQASPP